MEHRASIVPRHLRLLFQFLGSIRHLVGVLGGGISPAQGLYLHRTTQHRKMQTNIHAPSRIWICNPNVQVAEDSTCLRLLGHWDWRRPSITIVLFILDLFIACLFSFTTCVQCSVLHKKEGVHTAPLLSRCYMCLITDSCSEICVDRVLRMKVRVTAGELQERGKPSGNSNVIHLSVVWEVTLFSLNCKCKTFRWHFTSKWGGLWLPMSLVVQQPSNMEEQRLSDHAQWLQR
jgi:hypothetical protein